MLRFGTGDKIESLHLAAKRVTNTTVSNNSSKPQPSPLPPFKKKRFSNHENPADSLETILNILETKPVAGRAITIQPQKFPPR